MLEFFKIFYKVIEQFEANKFGLVGQALFIIKQLKENINIFIANEVFFIDFGIRINAIIDIYLQQIFLRWHQTFVLSVLLHPNRIYEQNLEEREKPMAFHALMMETDHQLELQAELQIFGALKSDDSIDAMVFWEMNTQNMPILASIARRILSIPVSNSCIEQIFSGARRIISITRYSMLAETLEAPNLIVANQEIFDNIREDEFSQTHPRISIFKDRKI